MDPLDLPPRRPLTLSLLAKGLHCLSRRVGWAWGWVALASPRGVGEPGMGAYFPTPTSKSPGVVQTVTQCPTLCDPLNCSMPGFPVFHHLPELAQTHVY